MGDPVAEAREKFWSIGNEAIKNGLLTRKELHQIARMGHSKQSYWVRHLRDLVELLEERKKQHVNINRSS